MKEFETKDYKVCDMFNNRWAVVTAGDISHYNACTIAWGSLGTIWGGANQGKPIVTIYINPDRYTWEFLKEHDTFTVAFLAPRYKRVLAYLGSVSGRDEKKIARSGLSPYEINGGVTYEEAELTFVARKIYQGPFQREGLADEINKGVYADWEPHWMFVGEIVEVEEKVAE